MASSTSARRPSWIGKYEVLEKIGEGGFAVVYKARDPFIKRLVAVKVCVSEDAELRDRFYREAEIAGNLHHRNIVTVFDFGVDEGRPYLVQEYLSGEDLKAKIQRRELMPPSARLDVLVQVAQGLAHAHAQGVLHRDVKPGNVRVLEDGSVKIMDFGIAKLASAETILTQRGNILGTAGYLPPEQVLGREADARSDVFSYGALAYEILAYEPPFPGKTVSEILQQVLQSEPRPVAELWRRCPSDLDALVRKCLRKDPAQRYAGFEAVLAELTPIVERLERRAARERRSVDGMSLDETVPVPVDVLRPDTAPPGAPGTVEPLPPLATAVGVGADESAPPAATAEPEEGTFVPPPPPWPPPPAERPTLVPRQPPSAPPAVTVAEPQPTPPLPPQPAAAAAAAGGRSSASAATGLRSALARLGVRLRRSWERARRHRRLAVGAAVALAAAVFLAWLALRPAGRSRRAPAPAPAAADVAPARAAGEQGRLLIDARPWAEVLELLDGDGNALPLPAEPYTPLTLEVPPGRYRASLSHPGAAAAATCTVEVVAGSGGHCWAELAPVEVDDYFRESGWWR